MNLESTSTTHYLKTCLGLSFFSPQLGARAKHLLAAFGLRQSLARKTDASSRLLHSVASVVYQHHQVSASIKLKRLQTCLQEPEITDGGTSKLSHHSHHARNLPNSNSKPKPGSVLTCQIASWFLKYRQTSVFIAWTLKKYYEVWIDELTFRCLNTNDVIAVSKILGNEDMASFCTKTVDRTFRSKNHLPK